MGKWVNINRFISEYVTERRESMFLNDIEEHHLQLLDEIQGRSVLVIGGAGSIGSEFIKAVLPFQPDKLVVVDLNENGLAELTRDLRSDNRLKVPKTYLTYTLNFADPIFEQIFRENGGFDIVANFSAHKHVRSERDKYSVRALIENNCLKAKRLMDLLAECPPRHFFCVSTDKAANPVNVMGASKRVMEDIIMMFQDRFPVTTARFANVAFSNGSLPASWLQRMMKRQPVVAPTDVRRYFVSPEESGQICLLACVLGNTGEIFFPKLEERQMKTFSEICDAFVRYMGFEPLPFSTDEEARQYAAHMDDESTCYPVVYTRSDTTGEKDMEEFVVNTETTDMLRFHGLGVIENTNRRPDPEKIYSLFGQLEDLFCSADFTKDDIVKALESYLPNFAHEEKGRNLDSKM